LYEFGKALPQLRKKLKKDIAQKELTEEKVLAAVINLMEQTYIRIGSNGYEKLYGSYGLTTLKDKHVSVKNEKILFCFTGKKGIEHTITLKNKRLARIVKQCRDIPGKELFQYYDYNGIKKSIESGRVNNYIQTVTGRDFSSKDFRTWAGTPCMLFNVSVPRANPLMKQKQKEILWLCLTLLAENLAIPGMFVKNIMYIPV
jgi:DNA topoisomerase-1